MRRWLTVCAAAAAAMVSATERPCPAMSGANLTGQDWSGLSTARLTVSGEGTDTDRTPSVVSFTGGAKGGKFAAVEDDHGTERVYTGTWSLANGGRQMRAQLNAGGRAATRTMLNSWLRQWARSEGATVTSVSVGVTTMKPAGLPAGLGAFTLTTQTDGVVRGRYQGQGFTRNFTHTASSRLTPQ